LKSTKINIMPQVLQGLNCSELGIS